MTTPQTVTGEKTGAESPDTIPKLIRRNNKRWGERVAMGMKRSGVPEQYRWREYYENVKHFSLGLVSLGLKRKDVVCIIGDNQPEWFWGEFATQAAGGVATGIPADSVPSEVEHIASHSGARFAIVNDQEQAVKFLEIKDKLPALKKVIYWDPEGLESYSDPILIGFPQVIRLGMEYEEANPDLFDQNVEKGKGTDIAFIYYVSETTGSPKGARLSHRSLISTAVGVISRCPIDQNDNLVSSFPPACVGDSFFTTIPHLLTGARLDFPAKSETGTEGTPEAGPIFVIRGPRQLESLVSDIQVKMSDAYGLKRFGYDLFLPVSH